jgi:competence protein ComEA
MKMPIAVAAAAVGAAAVVAAVRVHAPSTPPPVLAMRPASPLAAATASPAAAGRLIVYVAGEVQRPGVYEVAAGGRVQAALRAASGATAKADLLAINLAEPLADGEKVLVPAKGAGPLVMSVDPAPQGIAAGSRASHARGRLSGRGHRSRRSHKAPPAQPIDINAATVDQLEELPGIGPSLAERIVAFRQVNGPFRTTDELLDVAGMTDRRLDAISSYVLAR